MASTGSPASTGDRFKKFGQAAANAAVSLTRSSYFDSNNDRGENHELRADLASDIQLVKKDAVKQVIANMTVGKDVGGLFADVLKCMQTDDLELKKLVYLYLMNYAKSQPELVILADTEDPSPILRALALRTMSCIRVERIVDYLCEPLHRTLKDENAYVRKTAVICVAKLFDLSPDLVEENGFLDMLQGMLTDTNPSVLANVVATLTAIHEANPTLSALPMDSRVTSKIIAVMGDCSEWGQITILEALGSYRPGDFDEIEFIIESALPRLQHVNPAVALAAIKLLITYMELLPVKHEIRDTIKRKLAPSLVTLTSAAPEAQYVALRSMNLILRKYPEILSQGIRVFFCKYNDPPYIKVEKLRIIILLASVENVEQIYPELADYAKEVDVEFVSQAIRAIGEVVLQVPESVHHALDVLSELAKIDISHVMQEIVVTLRDILRQFPGSFEGAVSMFVKDLDCYDDPEARAAFVWLAGEYPQALSNSLELLQELIGSFKLESFQVQSELFTACLKLYLANQADSKTLLIDLICAAKASTDNADIRDRAIFYERLAGLDPHMLQHLSLTGAPPNVNLDHIDNKTLDLLLENIGRLASVYHQNPAEFVQTQEAYQNLGNGSHESLPDALGASLGIHTSSTPVDRFADLLSLDNDVPVPDAKKPDGPGEVKFHENLLDLLGD